MMSSSLSTGKEIKTRITTPRIYYLWRPEKSLELYLISAFKDQPVLPLFKAIARGPLIAKGPASVKCESGKKRERRFGQTGSWSSESEKKKTELDFSTTSVLQCHMLWDPVVVESRCEIILRWWCVWSIWYNWYISSSGSGNLTTYGRMMNDKQH